MHNDEFDSNHAQGGDAHRHGRQARRSHPDDEDHTHRGSRDRQRTTAIALSVVTCLFMCVIGYEIIRENSPKNDDAHAADENPKPSLALSRLSVRDNTAFLASDDIEEDSYENHQIRLLQEQNRKQAAKIKALRHELMEKMQGMHEIKANLFKQEGDPRDKAKIADLSQQLEEKEKAAHHLAATLKNLELEMSGLQRKIEHSEVTRDALASMIETQRIAKEQERIIAQKQIEELQQASADEILALRESILDMERSLALLDKAYAEKVDALEQINNELSNQYDLLDAKTKEHQELSDVYQSTRENMTNQILDLIAGLEWEATSKAHVTNQLLSTLEKQNLHKNAVISLLETELQKRNEIIARNEAEGNLQRNSMGFTANEAQEQLLNLIATLELEMTRASFLQQDLDRSIYVQQQNLNQKAEAIDSLEHDLKRQKLILEKKGEELENLVGMLQLTREENKERMQDLVASRELETLRIQELEQALAANNQEKEALHQRHGHANATLQELQQANDSLSRQLADATQESSGKNEKISSLKGIIAELNEQISAKDTLLAARQLELQALMVSEAEATQSLRKQAAELSHQIEAGSVQLMQMHKEIAALLPHKEAEGGHLAKIGDLEESIQALNKDLEQKEMALAQKQMELESFMRSQGDSDKQLMEHIQHLSKQLQEDATRVAKLEAELQHAHQYKDAHAASLDKIDDLQQVAEAFRLELAEKEVQLQHNAAELERLAMTQEESEAALKKQIVELERALDQETSKLASLEEELTLALSAHSNTQEYSEQVNAKLRQTAAQAHSLEEKLKTAHQALSAKEEEINKLVNSKTASERELHAQIEQIQAQIMHERQRAETLQGQLHEKHAQYTELSQQQDEYELQISVLNNQLLQKERDLLATEEKLLLTLPQLEMMATENQHLQNSHGEVQSKVQETTRLLQQQQQQLKELAQRLEEEQKAYQHALARQEEQRRLTQQAAKKLEISALKAAMLEDQLNISNATLRRQENAVSALQQSQLVLKDDYETQLNEMRDILTREKDRARELNANLNQALSTYQEQQSEKASLQETVQHQQDKLARLEGQLSSLREQLAENEERLQGQEKQGERANAAAEKVAQLEEELSALRQQLAVNEERLQEQEKDEKRQKAVNEMIAQLKQNLEQEREKNLSIEEHLQEEKARTEEMGKELKKMVAAFKAQQNESTELQDAVREQTENSEQLKGEVRKLKEMLAAKEQLLQQQSEEKGRRNSAEEMIAQLKKNLEAEREKNKAIEADLKKVISAYNTEKQKLKDMQQKQIADKN